MHTTAAAAGRKTRYVSCSSFSCTARPLQRVRGEYRDHENDDAGSESEPVALELASLDRAGTQAHLPGNPARTVHHAIDQVLVDEFHEPVPALLEDRPDEEILVQ